MIPTLSKASVSARINAAVRRLTDSMTAYETAPKKTPKERAIRAEQMYAQTLDSLTIMTKLRDEFEKTIKEECTPGFHYDKQMFDTAFASVQKKMRARFGHFPIAAAMIEAVLMTLETEFAYFATIWALRQGAASEDRTHPVHQSFYHMNGEPNDIGNRVGKPAEE